MQERNNLCSHGIDFDTLEAICKQIQDQPLILKSDVVGSYSSCCLPGFVNESIAICGKTFDTPLGPVSAAPCHKPESFFTWDPLTGINLDLLIMTATSILYFLLIIFKESNFITSFFGSSGVKTVKPVLDDDVLAEQERIDLVKNRPRKINEDDILSVYDLRKNFGKFTAVDGLSFGVHHGECFGLLGINGAGKTTTFRMLTGDENISNGGATLLQHELGSDRTQFLRKIGYCPQFDSIIEVLTGREMLTLFARLRGIQKSLTRGEVDKWLDFLGIMEYADRPCGQYSGGNKRKLNVALALVGDPPLIFLDEPSTGVDPVARRNLWDIISAIQRNGQSVVLTSHRFYNIRFLKYSSNVLFSVWRSVRLSVIGWPLWSTGNFNASDGLSI